MSERAKVPFVSVIMPVRNEERTIARVLDCLLAQNYPGDKMEIIVADGMSTDNTRHVVSLAAAVDFRIRLMENPRRIMAAGFNAGLRVARGDIIIMMGGHTEVASNYIRACSSLLQEGLADCVGGPVSAVGETGIAQAIALAMSSRFGVGGVAYRVGCRGRKYVDTVNYGAYTRRIMERTGPLDEEFVRDQDDEFNYRLRKLGGKIMIAPEITSRYTCRSSIRSLWQQYFHWGLWKVRVLQKHPRQMQLRHFVPAAFVCSSLLFFVLATIHPAIGNRPILLLGGSYLLATLFASISLAFKRAKWWLAPALAITFPVLHFSYGTGFLLGLVKFCNRWRWSEWKPEAGEAEPSAPSSDQLRTHGEGRYVSE